MFKYKGPYLLSAGSEGNRLFGKLLQELRKENNLSAIELAKDAKVHVSFVRGIERGVQSPSLVTAKRLLSNLPICWRVRWTDKDENTNYDLVFGDPNTNTKLTFRFSAEVKGQNKRPRFKTLEYSRNILISTMIIHWPTKNSGCNCGWDELGKSFPEHVANMYEDVMKELFNGMG